jgi:hypothetical protein
MTERLWVWFTHYPTNGPSSMGMMPATDFVPVYLNIARNPQYRITRDNYALNRGAFRVYDLTGRLVMDAETL